MKKTFLRSLIVIGILSLALMASCDDGTDETGGKVVAEQYRGDYTLQGDPVGEPPKTFSLTKNTITFTGSGQTSERPAYTEGTTLFVDGVIDYLVEGTFTDNNTLSIYSNIYKK